MSIFLLLVGGWLHAEINQGVFRAKIGAGYIFVWLPVIHPASLKSSILKTIFTADSTFVAAVNGSFGE